MLSHPRFQPHLRVAVVPDEGVFILSGTKETVLRGRLYELVAPHVDGRSAEELCERLAEHASPAHVYFTLSQLEKRGYLSESNGVPAPCEAAWWSAQQVDPLAAARRLAESRVVVHALGVNAQPLCGMLAASGVRPLLLPVDSQAGTTGWGESSSLSLAPGEGRGEGGLNHSGLNDVSSRPASASGPTHTGPLREATMRLQPNLLPAKGDSDGPPAIAIVLTDHYLRPELDALNRSALAAGRPWLLVKPLGQQIWIGPLFQPGATGCWKCLAERLGSNRAVEGYLIHRRALTDVSMGERCFSAASLQTALAMATAAVTSWLVGGELPVYEGKILTFDLLTWQAQTHALARLPYCRACAPPLNGAARCPVPLAIESRKKQFVRDGGHRVVDPQATLDRFSHHVSPITGAVSMLLRSSPSDDGAMHVYLSGHNLARHHHSLGQLRGDLRNMSAGKGTTDVQAKASGLCEGLERYSGVFRGDETRRKARLVDLATGIDPGQCLLFSDRQYRERSLWNEKKSPYHFVPVPFDPEAEIEWSPLWSLTRQEARWLPTAFCYYDYPQPSDKEFCVACSNGCAAGNTLEEAILQGFLELVERDSVALWWYNRVRRPGVDLASFEEPYLTELTSYLATRRREMFVLDLTADLGIPVFAAWSRRTDSPREEIVLGFGAHLDPRIALLRAVTEMNQMLSYLLQAPPDKVFSEHLTDEETVHWLKTATAANQPYLRPSADERLHTPADYSAAYSDDVADDVRLCQSLVERQGLEMLVLDQTRTEIGLPVVKVVVPGLRHFWARFAPGRLYDVPVKLGWLDQPRAEGELNPVPMFL